VTAAFLRANRRTWRSLRKHRNYRIFFSGQVVSVTGTWMQNIAAAWLVLELTHSPVAVGLLMLCQFLPATVFGLFSGVLVDRLDVRKTVIVTQAASMVLAAALAGITLGGVVEPWMVYLLTALRGISLVVDHPARQAFTFQLVGPRELPNAVALNSGLFNGTRVLGPALGGVVIAVAGPGACFLLNAVSFVAVLASLRLIRPEELVPLDRGDERPTLVRGSREAFAFVRRVPLAGVLLGTVLLVTTFAFNFNVLLPVLAKQTLHDGPEIFGVVTACFGAGALLGALASASISRASPRLVLAGTTAFGFAELALAPQSNLGAVCPLLFAAGLAFTLWTSNANASLQLSTPDRLRGRMMGFYYFAFNGAGPVGGLLAGSLAAWGGTALAFTVGGTAAVLVAAGAYLVLSRAPGRLHPVAPHGTVSA
jgi:MFS family permease